MPPERPGARLPMSLLMRFRGWFDVGQDNGIHELRLESTGWKHAPLSELSHAPGATGSAFAYVTPDAVPRVVYVGQDNGIHELRLESTGWKHAPLSELSHAPGATGSAFAHVTPDAVPRVVYVGQDNGIHELRLESTGWKHAPLSELSHAPGATGSAFAHVTPDAVPRVVYVGQDNGIHELRLESTGWKHAPLSELSHAPGATGSAFAHVTPDAVPRVVYVGQDGHIHEQRLESSGWKHADVSSTSAASADLARLDSGPLTSDQPLGGSVTGVINKDGDFTFSSHAHGSGFDPIDYVIVAVLMTPDGFPFTFQHSGSVGGGDLGGSRDDDFGPTATVNNHGISVTLEGNCSGNIYRDPCW